MEFAVVCRRQWLQVLHLPQPPAACPSQKSRLITFKVRPVSHPNATITSSPAQSSVVTVNLAHPISNNYHYLTRLRNHFSFFSSSGGGGGGGDFRKRPKVLRSRRERPCPPLGRRWLYHFPPQRACCARPVPVCLSVCVRRACRARVSVIIFFARSFTSCFLGESLFMSFSFIRKN